MLQRYAPIETSPNVPVNCQEKTSSTYGTYPPDLAASTIPTKVNRLTIIHFDKKTFFLNFY